MLAIVAPQKNEALGTPSDEEVLLSTRDGPIWVCHAHSVEDFVAKLLPLLGNVLETLRREARRQRLQPSVHQALWDPVHVHVAIKEHMLALSETECALFASAANVLHFRTVLLHVLSDLGHLFSLLQHALGSV